MKSCKSCNCQLEEQLTACPTCGDMVLRHESSERHARVRQLLAEANLLRIQRDFKAAVDRCADAIDIDPDNPEVHSLLGDIYSAQGNLREAAKWYETAIELRPDCAIDLNKLRDLQGRFSPDVADASPEITGSCAQPELSGVGDQKLKVFVLACVVLMTILLAMGFGSWVSNPGVAEIPAPSETSDDNTQKIGPSTSVSTNASVRPVREQDLVFSLATHPNISAEKIVVEDARLDPRNGSVVVTLWDPDINTEPTKSTIMADAEIVARVAFDSVAGVKRVTARVILQVKDSLGVDRPQFALVCDFYRPSPGKSPSPNAIWWGSKVTK